MAIDLTGIATNGASQTVAQMNNLMSALEAIQVLQVFLTEAGIPNFTLFETEIQAIYPHLDGAKLNQLYNPTSGGVLYDLLNYLNTTTVASGTYTGQTYHALLNMIRDA